LEPSTRARQELISSMSQSNPTKSMVRSATRRASDDNQTQANRAISGTYRNAKAGGSRPVVGLWSDDYAAREAMALQPMWAAVREQEPNPFLLFRPVGIALRRKTAQDASTL